MVEETGKPAKVIIVDDDEALCELARERIDAEDDLKCVDTASNQDDAVTAVRRHSPEVVLLDPRREEIDWFAIAGLLLAECDKTKVLVWTKWTDPSVDREEEIRRKLVAAKWGIYGWVSKGDGIDLLIGQIRAAIVSATTVGEPRSLTPIEAWLSSKAVHDVLGDASGAALTRAERRIANFVPKGLEADYTIERLARILQVSPETLRKQLQGIYRKWGVRSQAAFVSQAHERGYC